MKNLRKIQGSNLGGIWAGLRQRLELLWSNLRQKITQGFSKTHPEVDSILRDVSMGKSLRAIAIVPSISLSSMIALLRTRALVRQRLRSCTKSSPKIHFPGRGWASPMQQNPQGKSYSFKIKTQKRSKNQSQRWKQIFTRRYQDRRRRSLKISRSFWTSVERFLTSNLKCSSPSKNLSLRKHLYSLTKVRLSTTSLLSTFTT